MFIYDVHDSYDVNGSKYLRIYKLFCESADVIFKWIFIVQVQTQIFDSCYLGNCMYQVYGSGHFETYQCFLCANRVYSVSSSVLQ